MADFRFFINRQGPRGPQGLKGEKGDPGNTFTVSEGVNTPTEYTLIFDGGDGNQFETDNLRNPIVDRGGTYVRYDRDNVTQYIGEPDMAVIDETPGIVNLAGKDTVTPNASDAVAYELLEKTVDELNTALENLDGRLDDAEGDLTQAQSDIVGLDNRVTTNEGNITSLQSGKADKSTTYTKTEVNNALAGKANAVHTHTVSQITNAGALASQNTVDYQTQVTNKPTIPTVGNGTITLTQGGVTKGTFTTNQSGNSTIDLDAGGTSSFAAGNAINISDNTISVKYDGTTIGLNASGQLQSLVEEPDMTQYYTKSQVDNLIPDISHMVTDNTTQSITGTKTFGAGNLKINDLCLSDGSKVIEDKGTYVYVGSPGVTTKIKSNNTKLYFNGQSGIDEEIAKVSQLPGAATSSALGLVQPDGTTIAVDANGVISANIPIPETVDQTYDATSTHAQSGVAIAGAGFMNGSIVQSPLEYLPDTTGSLTYQNVNTSTMVGSGYGIYINGGELKLYDGSGTEENLRNNIDLVEIVNENTACTYFETELTNGINFISKMNDNNSGKYAYMLGHYSDENFIPDALIWNSSTYMNFYFFSTDAFYDRTSPTTIEGFYQSGISLTLISNGTNAVTRTITSAESEILRNVTYIRVLPYTNSIATITLSDVKVVNPTLTSPVSSSNINTTFDSGTNIFDAHPESLSLKYDSTTLGINANNELYALSSAPSNMVTTNTQQIITGRKDMAIINIQPSGSTGYTNFITPYGSNGRIAISKDTSYDSAGTRPGILFDFSNSAAITSVAYGGNSNYINMCTQYGSNTAEIRFCNGYKAGQVGSAHAGIGKYSDYTYIRNNNTNDKKIYKITTGGTTSSDFTNFLLEKDMLDGTTISYDSTTGKISAGGNFVPTTRTVNNKALSSDITLTAEDLETLPVSDDLKEVVTIDYTIVGSPTISSDYELTNTSLSDYLTIAELPLRTAAQAVSHSYKFEAQFIPNTSTPVQNEAIFDRFQDSDGIRLTMTDAGKVRFRTIMNNLTADTDYIFSNTTVVVGTLYKVVAEIAANANTGTLTLYSSSDNGATWITEETGTLGSNTPFAKGSSTNTKHYIGLNGYGPSAPYNGTILLDKMLFYEDDVLVWTPVEITQGITEIGKASDTTYGLVTKNHPMPGDVFDFVTLGASGAEYTAYDTGWFILGFTASANNQYLEVTKPIANRLGVSLTTTVFKSQVYGSTSNYIGTSIPVKKGDKITVNYNTGGTNNIIFVPAAS